MHGVDITWQMCVIFIVSSMWTNSAFFCSGLFCLFHVFDFFGNLKKKNPLKIGSKAPLSPPPPMQIPPTPHPLSKFMYFYRDGLCFCYFVFHKSVYFFPLLECYYSPTVFVCVWSDKHEVLCCDWDPESPPPKKTPQLPAPPLPPSPHPELPPPHAIMGISVTVIVNNLYRCCPLYQNLHIIINMLKQDDFFFFLVKKQTEVGDIKYIFEASASCFTLMDISFFFFFLFWWTFLVLSLKSSKWSWSILFHIKAYCLRVDHVKLAINLPYINVTLPPEMSRMDFAIFAA